MSLLGKGAVETVPPAQSESGFYSRYFLVLKKDGPLRPILDLRHLNWALMKWPFRMITSKQILSQVCPRDWFFSLDLKNVYNQILWGSGLSIHGPSLWAIPSSPHFYEVHGCGSFSAEPAGNLHLELPWRLAHPGPVKGRASISQIRAPQPLRMPRTQGQSCQEHASPSQRIWSTINFINSARKRAVVTPECVLAIQQSLAHSKRFFGTLFGPASHAAPSVLAETSSSSTCLVSRTPPYQGEPGSAMSGRWEFILSVPPPLGSQNSPLYDLAAAPRGLRSDCPDG